MGDLPPEDLTALVEALIFVSPGPISLRKMCEIIPEAGKREIRLALDSLAERLNSDSSRGIELVEAAGGWRFQTRQAYRPWIQRLRQNAPQKLSRASMETLALIVYRQPVTRSEIEQVRGVDSAGPIRHLLKKRLITITGRKPVPGRPLLYGTTRHFLEVFQLKDLNALPSHEELWNQREIFP
jgi:segregation and condensation protein B